MWKLLVIAVLAACNRPVAPRECIAVRHPNGNPDWHGDTTVITCKR